MADIGSIAFGLFLIWAYLWTGLWAFHDAHRRGQPGLLVALLVLLIFWPLSLLVWLALRPPDRPRFNLDDFRVQ